MYTMGDIHISMLFLLRISVPAALLYGTRPSPQQSQMPASKDLYLQKISPKCFSSTIKLVSLTVTKAGVESRTRLALG